jgi:hypothetical protein
MMLASLLKHEHSSHGNLLQQMPLLLGTCLLAFVKTVQDDIKTLSDKVGEAKTKGAEKTEKPEATAGEGGKAEEQPKDSSELLQRCITCHWFGKSNSI